MAKNHHYYNKTSPTEEAYRTLRTNIQFSSIDKTIKQIIISSTNPNEGKTTTAIELAKSIVKNGDRVLLVDCDLRNPSVGKRIDYNNNVGLTNVLIKGSPISDVIKEYEGIHIILSGPQPPNPAELLGSKKMKDFLEIIKSRYDYILIDTPPAGLLTDAAILSRICDGAILVVGEGETEKADFKRTVDTIENIGGHVIGIVMTKVKSLKSTNYGKYY